MKDASVKLLCTYLFWFVLSRGFAATFMGDKSLVLRNPKTTLIVIVCEATFDAVRS